MDLPPSPDGGFYGFAPASGTPRWPWVARLLACFGEPTPPSGHEEIDQDDPGSPSLW